MPFGSLDGANADGGGVAAGAAIDVRDALDVGVGGGLAEGPVNLQLDLFFEILGLDLAVAHEDDVVDHGRILDHAHHEREPR